MPSLSSLEFFTSRLCSVFSLFLPSFVVTAVIPCQISPSPQVSYSLAQCPLLAFAGDKTLRWTFGLILWRSCFYVSLMRGVFLLCC